jgi:hypothetical protein
VAEANMRRLMDDIFFISFFTEALILPIAVGSRRPSVSV